MLSCHLCNSSRWELGNQQEMYITCSTLKPAHVLSGHFNQILLYKNCILFIQVLHLFLVPPAQLLLKTLTRPNILRFLSHVYRTRSRCALQKSSSLGSFRVTRRTKTIALIPRMVSCYQDSPLTLTGARIDKAISATSATSSSITIGITSQNHMIINQWRDAMGT